MQLVAVTNLSPNNRGLMWIDCSNSCLIYKCRHIAISQSFSVTTFLFVEKFLQFWTLKVNLNFYFI